MEVFALTHGQFSLVDALDYLAIQSGPCALSINTWTASADDITRMHALLAAGVFTSVRWLIDRSYATRKPADCALLRDLFGDATIRTSRTHAKFMTLRNDVFTIAVRTSMNLNENNGMEHIEISDDRGLCDFLDAEFDRYFAEYSASLFDVGLLGEKPTIATASAEKTPIAAGTASGKRIIDAPVLKPRR
jgi:hypothetical protein